MSDKRRYPFLRKFEAALALACVTLPRAYERVGHALDAERMNTPGAELLVRAAQAVYKDHGSPPTSREVVMQRIRSIVNEGKVTFEKLQESEALLDLAEDGGLCEDVESLLLEAIPVVRDFAGQDAIDKTLGELSRGVDPEEVSQRFDRVSAIGAAREQMSETMKFDVKDVTATVVLAENDRLATGIPDVDRLLLGGLETSALAVVLGQPGVGKSQFLIQVAAEAVFESIDVAYISLELRAATCKRRLYANLCNLTYSEMSERPQVVADRLEHLRPHLGRFEVAYFAPQVTTVADVARWLKERRRESRFDPRVLLFDMGDHFVSKVNTEKNSYEDVRIIYDHMRNLAVERGGWAWTASHVKSGNVGKKRVTSDQAADSAHKGRKADLMIAVTQTADDKAAGQLRYALPKRREDSDQGEAGPIPCDLERGRIAIIQRRTPWG